MQKQPEVKGKIETCIEVSGTGWDFEITADVWYLVEAYDPGNISGSIDRCRPPSGGGVEVQEVNLNTHEKFDPRTSNDISERIKNQIRKSAESGQLSEEIKADAEAWIDTYEDLAAEAKMEERLKVSYRKGEDDEH